MVERFPTCRPSQEDFMPRRSLWLLVVGAILMPRAEAVRAELTCEPAVAEKGEARSGKPLSHRFTIVNSGRDAIEVTDVRPSCGCLAPKLDRRRFQPGESGSLLLEVNTLTQPAGAHSWRATIHYQAAGNTHELSLYIAAQVVTEISVEPPSLAIYTDTSISHEIAVIDRRTEPLIVHAVSASSPHVRTHLGELHRNEAGQWVRSIQVEVLADCPEGTHEEALQIYTSDPSYAELKVPFTIVKRLRDAVSIAPSSILLSAAAGQPLPARIVLLSAGDDRPVRIEQVESGHGAIDCHWAAGPGPRATLKVRVDHTRLPAEGLQSCVRVRLSQPKAETITIPVNCLLH
jgi:hypothetical protein